MKTKNVTEKNMKVCLVGSSGGHLTHLYAPKVLRHSEIGFKTKLSILLRTFFPITFIKRDNKKAKLAYEKDTME